MSELVNCTCEQNFIKTLWNLTGKLRFRFNIGPFGETLKCGHKHYPFGIEF